MSTNQEKASWLTSILTGWGVKESWAKIIAGAIIGALIAAGILTTSGCSHNTKITAEQIQQCAELAAHGIRIFNPVQKGGK